MQTLRTLDAHSAFCAFVNVVRGEITGAEIIRIRDRTAERIGLGGAIVSQGVGAFTVVVDGVVLACCPTRAHAIARLERAGREL